MAISNVKICNMALSMLGISSQILALTEDSENARKCNLFFEQTRDAILREHPWNFAINRATLAELASVPVYSWDHAYQLPTSPYCLKLLEVKENIEDGEPYEVVGRTIETNAESCRIKYVSRETDPSKFDPMFVMALASRLAATLSLTITESNTTMAAMMEVYNGEIERAKEHNAIESDTERLSTPREDQGSWLSVR